MIQYYFTEKLTRCYIQYETPVPKHLFATVLGKRQYLHTSCHLGRGKLLSAVWETFSR